MYQIQRAAISRREFETEEEYEADDLDFESKNWETVISGENPGEAVEELLRMINGEELNDVEYWYRGVNTETTQVFI